MNKQTEQILDILNEFDPLDVISAGAPKDEYETEANLIYSRFLQSQNKVNFAKSIDKIFEDSFGVAEDHVDRQEIKQLSFRIYDQLRAGEKAR